MRLQGISQKYSFEHRLKMEIKTYYADELWVEGKHKVIRFNDLKKLLLYLEKKHKANYSKLREALAIISMF